MRTKDAGHFAPGDDIAFIDRDGQSYGVKVLERNGRLYWVEHEDENGCVREFWADAYELTDSESYSR